jgi:Fe-S-cluster containining protein
MFANRAPCCPRGRIDSHPDLPACAGCGRCCHLVVELRPGDVVPEEFVVEHAGARCMDQRGNGACVALDPATMLCTIYADRPQTCRDFNRGETLCRQILGKRMALPYG